MYIYMLRQASALTLERGHASLQIVNIYILGPNYCGGIFFKSLSYLYEVVRRLFCRFLNFSDFF